MKQQTFAKSLLAALIAVLMSTMTIISDAMVSASPADSSASLLESCTPATGVVIQPPYSSGYVACSLGTFSGLPAAIGAIAFKDGDPNTLLVAAYTQTSPGAIYSVPVHRDADNHIIDFPNPGTLFANAPYVSAGIAYGPGNVLFYSRWPANELGEIKPGSTGTDKVIALSPLGVTPAVSGLNFVPDGFPNEGELKLLTYQTGDWYAAVLSPEADGTFSIATMIKKAKISTYSEAFTYVPPSSPGFADYSAMLVGEYYNGALSAYNLDPESNPISTSRTSFLTGLAWIKGSTIDPVTGDLIVANRAARVISVRGFGTQPWVPTPTATPRPTSIPTYSIAGLVTTSDGHPVSGATIELTGVYRAETDSGGGYYFGYLPAGTYHLKAYAQNYLISPGEYTVAVPPDVRRDFTAVKKTYYPPVVIVHGWKGLPGEDSACARGVDHWDNSGWFDDLPQWLAADGFDVWVAHYDSGPLWTAPLEDNGKCLADQIETVTKETRYGQVILIAHSMGGPVSRAYLQSSTYARRRDVKTLITLGSPHGGINGLSLAAALPPITLPLGLYCIAQPAFCQMDPVYMQLFNGRDERNSVDYYMIGGDGGGGFLGDVLYPFNGANDGLVSVPSATGKYFSWLGVTNAVKHPLTPYQTHEDHLREWGTWYFEPRPNYTRSDSYMCIREILLGLNRVDCVASPPAQAMAQVQGSPFSLAPIESGHISTGETISRTLSIDTADRSLFALAWTTQTLSLALVDPNGVTIDPAYALSKPSIVTFDSGPAANGSPGWMTYAFTNTVPGVWTLEVSAPDAGPVGTDWAAIASFASGRILQAGAGTGPYKIGDTATLTATLTHGTAGIPGANVRVELDRPDSVTDSLTLTDMGDGQYEGVYPIPDTPGYVGVIFTASGEDSGTAFSRQSSQLLSIMPQTGQLTGSYADRAADENGDRWADALEVDVGIEFFKAGNYTLTADLRAGDQVVAQTSQVFSATAGSQTVTLWFDGSDIYDSKVDGPYLLTNLVLVDLQVAVPAIMQSDLYTTAVYDYAEFGPMNVLYLPLILR